MNAEIIAVGSELLLGQILNTNAQFLSRELAVLGINVYYHTVVGDNATRLEEAFELAQARSDLIIVTGGLGPTKDDLTKETLAKVLGTELVYDEQTLENIQAFFKRANREMTTNNRKQALIIKDSHMFNNKRGMAPGMAAIKNDKIFMLFPGPPHELQPMFLEEAKPFLVKMGKVSNHIISRMLRFYGIGEAQLEDELDELFEQQTNPTIATLAGHGEVRLRLTAKSDSDENTNALLNRLEDEILERVGRYFYGYDDTSLSLEVSKWLKKKKLCLASAESLTGGLFSEMLTEHSGAGTIYNGGVVTYTNESKEKLLNVPKKILAEHGAISAQCAEKMAEHVRMNLNADIGISFTGVAGPTKSEEKEVGTVFIGISFKDKETKTYSLHLRGNRKAIRKRSADFGFYYLLKELKKGN